MPKRMMLRVKRAHQKKIYTLWRWRDMLVNLKKSCFFARVTRWTLPLQFNVMQSLREVFSFLQCRKTHIFFGYCANFHVRFFWTWSYICACDVCNWDAQFHPKSSRQKTCSENSTLNSAYRFHAQILRHKNNAHVLLNENWNSHIVQAFFMSFFPVCQVASSITWLRK